MLERLRAAPITVALLCAIAVFVAWVPHHNGQAVTAWGPGALALLALLGLALVAVPGRWVAVPAAVRLAVVLLAAFTAWSALSILWADDQGAAWEGTNRTLLYLAVFALFALWPQRPATAGWVLGAWTLALGALATITLLRVAGGDPLGMFVDDRLADPAGYPNAAAATWMVAVWPAVTLAAARAVPWWLRGLFAAAAVVLIEVALLSQSRGSVLAIPFTLLVLVAVVPGRLRHLAVLLPIGGAVAAAAPAVLDLGPPALAHDVAATAAQADVVLRQVLLAAVAAGVVVAGAALLAARRPPGRATVERVRRGWTIAVVAAGVAGAVVGLAVAGNPVDRLDDAWTSFKGGYESNEQSGSRLVSGLGSNRYDFYRVALNEFRGHPVAGVGADNFSQDYLARGASSETPRYPHDLVLRTLAQTGVVGFLLLMGAFAAALAAALRGMRAGPLAAAVGGGAVVAFAYWFLHGASDWFWEWAGLGAPAFALLGLAASLAPRDQTAAAAPGRPMLAARPAAAGSLVLIAAGMLAVAAPWVAEREIQRAGKIFDTRPLEAYARLDRAAGWNPLSDRPDLVAGSIALRYGDLPRAESAFRAAVARNPRGQYATLELGAIASVRGRRAEALTRMRRAVALAPRDPLAAEALQVVRRGATVDIVALNRHILTVNQQLGAR